METSYKADILERLGTLLDDVRLWFGKSWKIGKLLVKGGYLLGERRRLFTKLGEEVYYKVARGEMQNADLESTVHQLDRLTKKVEIEEMLVRSIRFGSQHVPRRARNPSKEKNGGTE